MSDKAQKEAKVENEKIAFWSCDAHAEPLVHEEIENAVDEELDSLDGKIPETLEVHGFARMTPELSAENLLENALEWLDEEYGDPDGNPAEATPKMKAAAEAFAEAVLSEYDSWACELVTTKTVKTPRD